MRVALIGTVASSILGFRRELIKSMIRRGDEIYAFALDYDEDTRMQVIQLGAVPVDYRFSPGGMNPFADFVNTGRLAIQLHKISPDLVFSYFAKPVIFGTLAAALAGVKRRVAMLEGLGYIFTDSPSGVGLKIRILRVVQVFLYRCAFIFLDRLIFLNPDDPIDLMETHRLKVKRISVLGGIGLDLSRYPFSIPSTSPVTFLFVGRLLAEKGIGDFISAARLVKGQYPDARFIVLGGADQSNPGGITIDELEDYVRSGLLIYPGHVNDVVPWLSIASVFVLPSYYREGVPRSTQEAMAVGRAVITTNVPGCRETVVEGRNGFLVNPWSPVELAERMTFFIENKEKIMEMGLASYQLARERFDGAEVNARLLGMLD